MQLRMPMLRTLLQLFVRSAVTLVSPLLLLPCMVLAAAAPPSYLCALLAAAAAAAASLCPVSHAGITNCFLGLVLIHEDLEHRLAYWLGPTLALSIFWLLLAIGLEVKKQKVRGGGGGRQGSGRWSGVG
jgi:hypothetical protein